MPPQSPKVHADAVLSISVNRERFRHGAFYTQRLYTYGDRIEKGRSHCIVLASALELSAVDIWELLLEEVLTLQQEEPASLALVLDLDGARGWQRDAITALVAALAHELDVEVRESVDVSQ